jgi:hypothetical protein
LVFLFIIYSYVYILFGPSFSLFPVLLPCPPAPSLLQVCWRENIRDNNKDILFLLARDTDSYTDRFLALLPCTCISQPELVHLYQTSSLLPGHLPFDICFKVGITIIFFLIFWCLCYKEDKF